MRYLYHQDNKKPQHFAGYGAFITNEVIMEKNPLSVKSKSGLVFPALVAIIIFCVVFFAAIKEADRQEHEAAVVKVQVQSEREAQSLYAAAKGDRQ
jgi:high-affinity K+ transport system ATPase subunit B